MADLTFQQLARANRQRCENGFRRAVEDWSPGLGHALAAEVGEACNLIQKLRRGEEVDLDAIADELADAVMNADLLCQRLGWTWGRGAPEVQRDFPTRRIGRGAYRARELERTSNVYLIDVLSTSGLRTEKSSRDQRSIALGSLIEPCIFTFSIQERGSSSEARSYS